MKNKPKKSDKIKSISLVVPAHNASHAIVESIKEYSDFLNGSAEEYELIVVCNACTDDTEKLAKEQAAKEKSIRIVSIPERGKGFAILAGFRAAKHRIIGFMDADCVFKLDKVVGMIHQLEDDSADCVIASKWLGRNVFQISEPFTRKVLAVGWKALALLLLHMRFHDTQGGAKFMKKEAFDAIDTRFLCTGFDFDVELLYRLKRKGCRIKEVNIPILKTFGFSTFRLRFVPGMFWRIFKLSIRKV